MKNVCLVLLLLFESVFVTAQKSPLDFSAIDSWPHIENEKISDDGRYVLYNVSSKKEGTTLVVQATGGAWNIKIKSALQGTFTDNSKHVIFKTFADSLGIVELETGNVHLIDKAMSFAVLPTGSGQWMAYQLQDQERDLVLLELVAGVKRIYPHTKDFTISDDGERLLLHQSVSHGDIAMDSVTRLDVNSGNTRFIWCGTGASNWVMDSTGSQIAFALEKKVNNQKESELWYYKNGMDRAALFVNDSTNGMQGVTVSSRDILFSQDGNNLFFRIHVFDREDKGNLPKKQTQCVIWSYRDKELNASFENHVTEMQAVVNLHSPLVKVVRIETKEGDISNLGASIYYSKNKVILLANALGQLGEYNWRASARPDLYFVSTLNGTRTLLKTNCLTNPYETIGFSPSGNYIYWFDQSKRHWFTYNLETGIIKNITAKIPFSLTDTNGENPGVQPALGIAAWIENDTAILIYDKYDIWEVDPDGMKPPRNITAGYGRKHHEILRLLNLNGDRFSTFTSRDTLTLYTVNTVSKLNGFAQITLDRHDKLITLSQNPTRTYGVTRNGLNAEPSGFFGLKAKNANAYIFRPTCDTVYPNIVFTGDLAHFQQLSELEPQKQYNWYTSELIHWKQSDGITNDGILFKPEDFDPKKKYPLIVYIYEKFSNALNVFLRPALARGEMEVLWYVSHGYLVLTPDIHYKIGHPGESAFYSVVSAVHYLAKLPWVDRRKLGLQGHSFGGYETNYIVTRTNLFAAVCSANAVTDLISNSGHLLGNSFNSSGYQVYYEMGQGRMGTTLWSRPDLYVEESPIFGANKVNTPLLILHSPLDVAVPFSQGMEWFTGLRRLGKKAWMLQYPTEDHNLESEENQLDYTIRMNQFFDHFLKQVPAPKWMTEGGNSLELDTSGKQP